MCDNFCFIPTELIKFHLRGLQTPLGFLKYFDSIYTVLLQYQLSPLKCETLGTQRVGIQVNTFQITKTPPVP